jgi:hypothetical protein
MGIISFYLQDHAIGHLCFKQAALTTAVVPAGTGDPFALSSRILGCRTSSLQTIIDSSGQYGSPPQRGAPFQETTTGEYTIGQGFREEILFSHSFLHFLIKLSIFSFSLPMCQCPAN